MNQQLYDEVRLAKLGGVKLPVPLEQLRHWTRERFSANVLHVVYDTEELESVPCLTLIFQSEPEYPSLRGGFPAMPNVNIQETVVQEFATLVNAAGMEDQYDTTNVRLRSENFTDACIEHTIAKFIAEDKHRVLAEDRLRSPESSFERFSRWISRGQRRSDIWDIFSSGQALVVFYRTESVYRRNLENGRNHEIKQRCFELVKQYDEFGYITLEVFELSFDIKDILENRYGGDLYRYFK